MAREQAIKALHKTASDFMRAETTEEVANVAVTAVRDVLDMQVSGIHLYDDQAEGLCPVAWTERTEALIGALPTFEPGDSIAWKVFATGEAQIYDDISTVPDRYNHDTEIRSQISLPLGDHGVLLIGSTEVSMFDETTLLRAVPRRDASGEVLGTMAMYLDITEREEVKRANEHLENSPASCRTTFGIR